MAKKWWSVVCLAVAALVAAPGALAAEKADPYPLNVCPVSGKELGDGAVNKEYDGRQVRFCCDGCPAGFEKDAAASFAKLDEKIVEAQGKDYPVAVCLNSGAPLGDGASAFVIGNRLVKTCCDNCKAKVEADEAAFIEKHTAAVAEAQGGESYPSKTCPVSGEPLGSMGDPVNIVVGNSLVKVCCAGCEKGIAKDPAKMVAKVWNAEAGDAAAASSETEKAGGKYNKRD